MWKNIVIIVLCLTTIRSFFIGMEFGDHGNNNTDIDDDCSVQLEECQNEIQGYKDCAYEHKSALIDAEDAISDSLSELEFNITGNYSDIYNSVEFSIDRLGTHSPMYGGCRIF